MSKNEGNPPCLRVSFSLYLSMFLVLLMIIPKQQVPVSCRATNYRLAKILDKRSFLTRWAANGHWMAGQSFVPGVSDRQR